MEWWTHLWLNEGFASWIEYLCVDFCFPDWEIWTQFVNHDANRALSLDALLSSHPIEVEVGHPSEIDEIFDAITYSKGCSVIRMLAAFVGEADFKKGLHIYLNRFKYQNALTEDLWTALEETSGKPVRKMMESWIKQIGFPVVSVEEISTGKFSINQIRFLANTTPSEEEAKNTWYIPAGYITSSGEKGIATLDFDRNGGFEANVPADGWIKLNPDQTGFFRVKYSDDLLKRLVKALSDGALKSPIDRLELQNDATALARAGLAPTTQALDILLSYQKEVDFTVWTDVATNFGAIGHLVSFTDGVDHFKAVGRKLFKHLVNTLGFEAMENEQAQVAMLRALGIRSLGLYGDEETITLAKNKLKEFLNDRNSIAADLRSAIYQIALNYGGEEEYESVLRIYKETDLQEEKNRCVISLASTNSLDLLKRTLEFAITDVKPQDCVFAINAVAANPKGRDLAWEFVKANWKKIFDMYKGGFLLNRVVKGVSEVFTSAERIAEIRAFFVENPVPAAKRALEQALETSTNNQLWLAREEDNIINWLKQNA